MVQQQMMLAIGRIERAVSRIEQIGLGSTNVDDHSGLAARHEQLKNATRETLAELDALIAKVQH